jgi:hypothetical protein
MLPVARKRRNSDSTNDLLTWNNSAISRCDLLPSLSASKTFWRKSTEYGAAMAHHRMSMQSCSDRIALYPFPFIEPQTALGQNLTCRLCLILLQMVSNAYSTSLLSRYRLARLRIALD